MTLLVRWSIAWAVGIWLGSSLALPLYAWAGAALVALLAAVPDRAREARLLLSCAAALALGATRLALATPRFDEQSLSTYNDRGEVTLVGVVAAEPDVRDTFVFYKLDAQSLALGDTPSEPWAVHGAARLMGSRYPVYAYGDRLQVRGELQTPPVLGDLDYRDYLARKGVYSSISFAQVKRISGGGGSTWKRVMLAFKDSAKESIARILPEPEASLLSGILLGAERGIPADTMQAFSATGTTHVIAISGFNISIVAGLLMATIGRVLSDRRLAAGIAILGVIVYTILVGADAAVVRAAIMGIVALIGVMVGRSGLAFNSLAAAGLVMTAGNPYTLWDVGFQLSVAATLGLILYSEPFAQAVQRLLVYRFSNERAEKIVGWVSEALLLTLAAQVLTAPLLIKYFGQLSLVTLLANALIVPVQPLVMLFGGLATLAGLVFGPLGRVLGYAAYLWLAWTIRVVEWAARFGHASLSFDLSAVGLVAVYAGIGGMTGLLLASPERRRALWQSVRASFPLKVALAALALVTIVAWLAVVQFPDGKLHVVFLDVGQGDAIFVETPGGVQILIDGGPQGSALLAELGRIMPFWDRTLDLVVLTHPHRDHITGLIPALERFAVRAVVAREQPGESELDGAWEAALAAEGARLIRGQAGTRMELSGGVTLDILHPAAELVATGEGRTNNNAVVIRLVYRDVAILLPGDIQADVERELVRSGAYLDSTLLKVPHHGAKTSSSPEFLAAVRPQVAVISVGAENDFKHPSREVLERLAGTMVYRTDQNGRVTVTSDGHTLWIETER